MRMEEARAMRGAGIAGPERPTATDGRELISVRGLLEWAFAVECASLDFDEIGDNRPAVGNEYRIMQQGALGLKPGEGVRVFPGNGVSHPHEDADIVSSLLRNSVQWHVALRVAELARTCRTPRWDLGTPRLVPRNWGRRNHVGQLGRTEVIREVSYVVRGRRRVRKDLWVPCTWAPGAAEVAGARRQYLDWWGALLTMRGALSTVELRKFHVIEALPPREPWKKGLTQSS